MRKQNICNYSDNWQPYIGDYDKYEYDIQLKDCTIITNCYPNAGHFQSMYTHEQTHEDNVKLIRFSAEPRTWLNQSVSSNKVNEQDEDYSMTFEQLQYKQPLSQFNIFNFYLLRDEYNLVQKKESGWPKSVRDLIIAIYEDIVP